MKLQANTPENAQAILDHLEAVSSAIASGPRVGNDTLLSLKLLREIVNSDVLGGQIVFTIPTSPNKPIDVAFATTNLPIKASL